MPNTYQTEKTKYYTQKTRELLRELPQVCGAFFRAITDATSPLTRYAYAVDLKSFFAFLTGETGPFCGMEAAALTAADLEKVTPYHIEVFLDEVSLYYREEREVMNQERAKARKLSSLRAFFKYCFKQEMISRNVAALVDQPKIREKAIIRLEPNEVAELLDRAESGEGLTDRQKGYHQATRVRDLAILTLFLGTGIRISELVGIDCDDIDFENDAFVVTRKGGYEDILAFSPEVHRALWDYALERDDAVAVEGHEAAFFLSLQRRRITVRAVEKLVKKYAAVTTPLKKITPHKLRSTYGTMLYRETQDIYLVADVLGHKDVNTTRKHYAAQAQDNRRLAAKKIHLREDD